MLACAGSALGVIVGSTYIWTRTNGQRGETSVEEDRSRVPPPEQEDDWKGTRVLEPPATNAEDTSGDRNRAADSPEAQAEYAAEAKRRALRKLIDQFDGKEVASPDWPGLSRQELAPVLVIMSVAAVMDVTGTSRPSIADGKRRDPFEGGVYDCSFLYNSRSYQFKRGEFPIYDEYKDLAMEAAARRRKAEAERASSETPLQASPLPPEFPEEFLNRVSAFGHGVAALWE